MNTEQIKDKVKAILSLPSGSAGRGVIGRGTAQAMLDVIEALEAERDSYRASFNNERIRADLALAQCDDIRATISGPSKEIDNLKLRIDSLMGRVDLVESTAPTPFAYNAACKALDKHRARADAAEAEIARRDAAAGELVHLYREHNPGNGMKTDWIEIDSEQLASLKESTDPETAEFRTLQEVAPPADAGEPVYQLWSPGIDVWVECNKQRYDEWAHMPAQRRTLYTSAPPAALPPPLDNWHNSASGVMQELQFKGEELSFTTGANWMRQK